ERPVEAKLAWGEAGTDARATVATALNAALQALLRNADGLFQADLVGLVRDKAKVGEEKAREALDILKGTLAWPAGVAGYEEQAGTKERVLGEDSRKKDKATKKTPYVWLADVALGCRSPESGPESDIVSSY